MQLLVAKKYWKSLDAKTQNEQKQGIFSSSFQEGRQLCYFDFSLERPSDFWPPET